MLIQCLSLVLVFMACITRAAEWQHPLWLGRGEVWRARFPVTVSNPSDSALEGEPVALTVGSEPCQAPLAGARAEAVRVTDANGTQLLFGLWSPNQGAAFTTGAIPAGATLVLPAVCAPHTSTTYTVYFDNPRAWSLSDFFAKRTIIDLNGDFETGVSGQPLGWQAAQTSPRHRLAWSEENPFTGARCLKAEADAQAEPTWFGFVRSDFAVVPGAKCTLRVRVRGANVKGTAGWYVHVGDEKNPQRINQVVRTGDGTFDWKEQVIAFTVPEGATRLQTGSVLHGTGTAWYDAFSFETDKQPPRVTAQAGSVERLTLQELGADAPWPASMICKPHGIGRLAAPFLAHRRRTVSEWAYRLPVRLVNLRDEPAAALLAVVDLNSAARGIAVPKLLLTLNGEPVETCRLGDRLLFTCSPAARTALTYYLYVADTGAKTAPAKPHASALGSAIPSDQILADRLGETDAKAFAKLLNSPVNLVKNPDFESGADAPEAWTHSTLQPGVVFSLGTPGGFGKRHARLLVPPTAKDDWRGWYQSVPVKPGHSYLYGAWLSCEALQGTANLNAHLRTAKGAVVPGGFLGAGSPLSGDAPWTPMFGTVTIPKDATQFQMHLTMNDRGTLKHDGVFLAECLEASTGDPETPALAAKALEAWPVDPVIKVFRETLPPSARAPLAVSLARNEEEALQLALRSGRDIPDLRVEIDAPKNKRGQSLTDFTVGWVGYVPIDHRTAYYNLKTPAWELKYPTSTGASDGWSGWWPDPIRPTAAGSLRANQTQPVWISFKTASDTPAGRYSGKVRLLAGGKALATLPFTVTVWGFALPQNPSCAAIYDLRLNEHWLADGTSADVQRDRLMRFMASKKVCPDEVPSDLRFTRDAQGKIVCDFTAYDKAAQRYFDELKFPTSYMPNAFYLFGWEHPPKDILKEKPFEGDYPYTTADRTKLRPAYKQAYQACLRLYWEHVKAKGWADKLALYISDEPFLTKPHIIAQMKALCDMIHEVDPKIRIYCSTWRHCPEWNGYLDIWGVGHYGCFPVSEMQARKAAGERIWFTTDGQLCTDTPFCAVERLLPHYCFKYGADAYEFWGVSWLTYDPWQFGWHRYIQQSSTPGESYHVRYPNGDGYLLYPGAPIGVEGPVTTVRLEAARDGVEDFDYLTLLKARADKTGDKEAARLLAEFSALLDIPNAGGRYSTKILPDPLRLASLRLQAGAALERLSR
jgi:hypothetical protein